MSILTGAGRGGLHHVNIDCDFAGSGLQLGAAQNRRSFDDTVCVDNHSNHLHAQTQ